MLIIELAADEAGYTQRLIVRQPIDHVRSIVLGLGLAARAIQALPRCRSHRIAKLLQILLEF